MFSSFFSAPADPNAPNFHPVTEGLAPNDLFAELQPEDNYWLCAGGFTTETEIWYETLDDGTFVMLQIIHSAVGMWYPTIQFVCRIYNPTTGLKIWRSVNVTNFVPGSDDKRSSKSDQFTIKFKTISPTEGDSCSIIANLSDDLQLSFDITRPAAVPGFKIGKGPQGGHSNFGPDKANPEGYVVHRFWPRTQCSGHIIHKGQAIPAIGPGMFVHTIQGMRPNLIAASWKFATFHSNDHGGVSALQMEFKTTDSHGKKGAGTGGVTVNVGAVVYEGKLLTVTAETQWPGEIVPVDAPVQSRATHYDAKLDPDTGYLQPSRVGYVWSGPAISGSRETVKATLEIDVGSVEAPRGLVEKVDLLAEIPYAVKLAIAYVAGTKPYIYQFLNPAKLLLTLPGGENVDVDGTLFNEATFIS